MPIIGKYSQLIKHIKYTKSVLFDFIKMQYYYGWIDDQREKLKQIKRVNFRNSYVGESSQTVYPTNLLKYSNKEKQYITHVIPDLFHGVLQKINRFQSIDNQPSGNTPFILFICYSIPRHDYTASEFRLFNILSILLANNVKIRFLYCSKLYNDAKYIESFKGDIKFQHIPLNVESYLQIIKQVNAKFIWISELWRIHYVKFVTELLGRYDIHRESYQIILDTVDFHAKEFKRKYAWSKNRHDLERSNEFFKLESRLYRKPDIVVVVSEDDKRDIQKAIAGVRPILPFIPAP